MALLGKGEKEMEEDIKEQLKQELKQEMKQEQKKKRRIKVIVLLAIVIIAVVVLVCIRNTRTNNNYKNTIISQEQFSQYITEIPITIENWQDYISLEDIEEQNKDAFGEIKNIYKVSRLKLKDNVDYGYVVFKLKINKDQLVRTDISDEVIVTIRGNYENSGTIYLAGLKDKNADEKITDNTMNINNFQCIQVKGSVYNIKIPEELWQTDIGTGEQYINVGNENEYTTHWKNNLIINLTNEAERKANEQAET